jgi:2-keto-4-pentenoate hydratase/2-oxohepta-3-ene-1,7-dioic acid hydratase in catechol pathway
MKLCRFELLEDPGISRSGIYHDQRVYETEGMKAIGIHDYRKVKFLPPLGQPKSIRLFEVLTHSNHPQRLYSTYMNPTDMQGPLAEVSLPETTRQFDFEVRIGAVTQETGEQIQPREASGFLLGYTIYIGFIDYKQLAEEQKQGIPPYQAHDFPPLMGPFITTLDELNTQRIGDPEELRHRWSYEITVNNASLYKAEEEQIIGFSEILSHATKTRKVFPGELLCSAPLHKSRLSETSLGRFLQEEDHISVHVDPLGTLSFKVV